jgi:hypothetical protein
MPLRIANIGKTAAQQIVGYAIVEVVKMGKEPDIPDHPLVFELPGQPFVRPPNQKPRAGVTGVVTSLMYPSECTDNAIERRRGIGKHAAVAPLSEKEFNSLREGKSYLAIYGRVTYLDVFGTNHWTQFCKSIRADQTQSLPTQSTACANYAAVDSNTQ